MSVTNTPKQLGLKEQRKQDAKALAQLLFDVYKQGARSGNLGPGQSNAKQSKK